MFLDLPEFQKGYFIDINVFVGLLLLDHTLKVHLAIKIYALDSCEGRRMV